MKQKVLVIWSPGGRCYSAWFHEAPACWQTGETREGALENLRRSYPDYARQEWEVEER